MTDCQDRIGQCFFVDHGGGHTSVRLIVARQATDTREGDPVWIMAVFSCTDSSSSVFERRDIERELAYMDRLSRVDGNVRRLA